MQIIDQSCEIWEQGADLASLYDHVARCTRVCYQSEKKTKGESSLEFLKRTILKSEHLSVLEHGTVYLAIRDEGGVIYDAPKMADVTKYVNNPYSRVTTCIMDEYWYVTTNLRVIKENGWEDDLLKYICNPTIYHKKRVTVSFITSLGIAREFNRHRCHSISEESTRYCNYSKDKFSNNITFIKPYWYDQVAPSMQRMFDCSVINAECAYTLMTTNGFSAQEAREVLPLATKCQTIHTAYIEDWEQFFNLRYYGSYGKPHPAAKDLAGKLLDMFKKKGYIKFKSISDEI